MLQIPSSFYHKKTKMLVNKSFIKVLFNMADGFCLKLKFRECLISGNTMVHGQFVSYRIASNCNLQPQEIWAFSQFVNVQHYFAFGRDLLENLVSKLSTGHYCCHYICLDFFISTNPIAVFKSRSFSWVFELSNSLE